MSEALSTGVFQLCRLYSYRLGWYAGYFGLRMEFWDWLFWDLHGDSLILGVLCMLLVVSLLMRGVGYTGVLFGSILVRVFVCMCAYYGLGFRGLLLVGYLLWCSADWL